MVVETALVGLGIHAPRDRGRRPAWAPSSCDCSTAQSDAQNPPFGPARESADRVTRRACAGDRSAIGGYNGAHPHPPGSKLREGFRCSRQTSGGKNDRTLKDNQQSTSIAAPAP